MTAFTALRTRLYARCGITVASTTEQELANEALNLALAYTSGRGASQLRQVLSGYTQTALSTTVSSHTATNTYLTVSSATGVFPGDILNDTANSRSYLIRTVNSTTLDIGIPISSSINGNSVTITRRTLPLPTAGTVWEVWEKDALRPLTYNPLSSPRRQFETGTAVEWSQGFSETGAASYISLFPAPTTATQFLIVMTPSFSEDSDVYMSEALIGTVLAKAYEYRMLMSGPAGAGGAAEISRQLDSLRNTTSAGPGLYTK